MVSKAIKIRLGIFLMLGGLMLTVFFVLVAGKTLMQRRDEYFIKFANYSVAGLQVGGSVNYQGIPVGRVEQIKIDPKDVTKIIIRISVDAGTPIKADTEAVLTLVGITGVKAVELKGGTNQAKLLHPGAYIRAGSSTFDDLSGRAVSIADKIDAIATNINNLTDTENRENIANILKQTSLLLQDTRSNIATTLGNLNQLSANIVTVSAGLDDNMNRITGAFTKNLDDLTQTTTSSIKEISSQTTTSLGEISGSANRNITSLNDKVQQKLDLLASAAKGAIDTISVASKISLDKVAGTMDRNMEALISSTKLNIENLSNKLSKELDLISGSLQTGITSLSTQAGLILNETQTQLINLGTNSNAFILNTSKDIAMITGKINQSLDSVNRIIESPEFKSLVANVNTLSAQLAEANVKGLVTELTTTVNRAATLIGNIDRAVVRNRANLSDTLESLREAAENLNEFSRQIADQPSILLRGN